MISVSCVTSPGQIWLLIGQLDTIQPSHWLLPADGDIKWAAWLMSQWGEVVSDPMILLTRWRHHDCTQECSLYIGPITLYSAGQFSLGWSSAPVYCHTVNLVIKQPSPGRLLSTCQDPDCPVCLRDRVKGISLTSSDKRKRNYSQILLTSGGSTLGQRQIRVLGKYTVCVFVIYINAVWVSVTQ